HFPARRLEHGTKPFSNLLQQPVAAVPLGALVTGRCDLDCFTDVEQHAESSVNADRSANVFFESLDGLQEVFWRCIRPEIILGMEMELRGEHCVIELRAEPFAF